MNREDEDKNSEGDENRGRPHKEDLGGPHEEEAFGGAKSVKGANAIKDKAHILEAFQKNVYSATLIMQKCYDISTSLASTRRRIHITASDNAIIPQTHKGIRRVKAFQRLLNSCISRGLW